jgi:hypothetical protein
VSAPFLRRSPAASCGSSCCSSRRAAVGRGGRPCPPFGLRVTTVGRLPRRLQGGYGCVVLPPFLVGLCIFSAPSHPPLPPPHAASSRGWSALPFSLVAAAGKAAAAASKLDPPLIAGPRTLLRPLRGRSQTSRPRTALTKGGSLPPPLEPPLAFLCADEANGRRTGRTPKPVQAHRHSPRKGRALKGQEPFSLVRETGTQYATPNAAHNVLSKYFRGGTQIGKGPPMNEHPHRHVRSADTPAEADLSPTIPLVRIPWQAPVRGIIISEKPEGFYTHWYKGRTVPCFEGVCQPCLEGRRSDWHGFICIVIQKVRGVHVLEYPASGVAYLVAALEKFRTIRGLDIVAARTTAKPSATVRLELSSPPIEYANLPSPVYIRGVLYKIWGYREDAADAQQTTTNGHTTHAIKGRIGKNGQ